MQHSRPARLMRSLTTVRLLLWFCVLMVALTAAISAPSCADESKEEKPEDGPPSVLRVAFEEQVGDLHLRQYELRSMSQLSYLLSADGEAVVVDPIRDVDRYVEDAAGLGMTITKVILTHTHVDFVSGHTALGRRTGAQVLVSEAMDAGFECTGVSDGTELRLGTATLEFQATPGPTSDGLTVLVHTPATSLDPLYAFTGDTLLLGDVGSPEAVTEAITPMALAEQAFDSVQRYQLLPADTRILPAHGGGAFQGRDLGEATMSTMGQQRKSNPYLQTDSRGTFVSRLLFYSSGAPEHLARVAMLNRAGPADEAVQPALPPPVSPKDLALALAGGAWVADLRPAPTYAEGHVRGALNLAIAKRFEIWTSLVVPDPSQLYLVGTDDEVRDAALRLRRIGYDAAAGRLAGGMKAWTQAGLPVATNRLVEPRDLARRRKAGLEPVIVDVRGPRELGLRLGDHVNVPLLQYARLPRLLERERPLLFFCSLGFRSNLAMGLAERAGFQSVASLQGGLKAWMAAGLPVVAEQRVVEQATPAKGE